MSISNWLLVAMGLLFIIPPVIYKMYFLALAFMIFGIVFGFTEFMANYYTGSTISQQLWALIAEHKYKGYLIIGCMLLAWICLLLHLGIRFKK
jgi:hypothetical protein